MGVSSTLLGVAHNFPLAALCVSAVYVRYIDSYSPHPLKEMLKRRSSGARRLRSSYIGRNFSLDNRQFVVDDVIAEGELYTHILYLIGCTSHQLLLCSDDCLLSIHC